MTPKLTARQQELLDFLHEAYNETGVIPSTREIQAHFGFASQTAAMSHLRALERKGVIKRLPNKARAVVFPEQLEREEIVDIPVYGEIAAGMAQDVEPETVTLEQALVWVNEKAEAKGRTRRVCTMFFQ